MDSISDRIIELRKILKLSQEKFASKINLTKFSISNYEKNKRVVTERIISDICREFDVNEEWLRNGVGEIFVKYDGISLDEYSKKYNLTELEINIIKAYIELDEDIREPLIEAFKKVILKDSIIDHTDISNDNDINIEVENYRQELLEEKKGQKSKASDA